MSANRVYTQIVECPLRAFIGALVDNNLAALIISGFPTKEALQRAFNQLQEQYNEATGDEEYKVYLKLFREVTGIAKTISLINIAVDTLYKFDSKVLADGLNDLLKTNFEFTVNRDAELKRCIALSKGLKLNLDLKNLQYKAVLDKYSKKETGKPTKEYFESLLITLSDHAQFQLQDSITVYQFTERLRRFNSYVEHQEKQLKK